MANLLINSFDLVVQDTNQLRLTLSFTLQMTATEASLGIPCHVWVRLMQKKGTLANTIHLYADESTTQESDNEPLDIYVDPNSRPPQSSKNSSVADVPVSGWEYAGLFESSGTHNFSFLASTADIPASSGPDEWYVIAIARPDVTSSVAYTRVIALDS